jgi:hypothetical protein
MQTDSRIKNNHAMRPVRVACMIALVLFLVMASGISAYAGNGFDDPNAGSRGGSAGGDVVAANPNVDGGTISIGATAQIVVLFRNDSGLPVTTGPIQLYPGSTVSSAVALNQCGQEPLPPGGVCAVSISVKALSPGDWRVEMLMRHSGRARLVTATVSGKIDESENQKNNFTSDIEAIPSELKMGQVTSGQPVVKGVILRNTTSNALDIKSIYIEAAEQSGFSLKTDCEKLEPGQACMVTVTWSPVQAGDASGVLLVEHNGPTSVASVPLDGQFNPAATVKADPFPKAVPGKGLLVASQDSIDFGTGIATTSAITVSLVNVGDAPINLKDVRLSSGDNGLSITKNGCQGGMLLEPVDACPLTISWSPVREGSVIDDVQIFHDGARGVLVLPVRGAATAIISQDSKAVRLDASGELTTVPSKPSGSDGGGTQTGNSSSNKNNVDPASVLDGFVVTSHSPNRAIITGPGGSRIVFDGQQVVIGGFLWNVNIRPSGVEFRSGTDKVLLLFDRSLSSINRVTGQSGSSGTTGGTTAAPASTPAPIPAAAPAQ